MWRTTKMNEIQKKIYLDCKYLDAGMDGMLCSMDMCTTCKEFNGEHCSYFKLKENLDEIEQKEIEQIAKALDEIEAIMWENAAYDTPDMAKAFYNAGYRQVKDKIVLTEREHEIAMKNQYDVGFRFGCKKMQEELRQASELKAETIKLAKQEMAKDIKNKFKELLSQYCETMSRDFAFKILDKTIEQCEVSIEE